MLATQRSHTNHQLSTNMTKEEEESSSLHHPEELTQRRFLVTQFLMTPTVYAVTANHVFLQKRLIHLAVVDVSVTHDSGC